MKRGVWQSTLGEVHVWADATALKRNRSRPAVLMIGGAFQGQPNGYEIELPPREHRADFYFAHLPGNYCPELRETSVSAYAQALDELVAGFLTGRPVLVLGVSIGGLVAAAMRASEIRELLLLDPPFATAKAWPLKFIGRRALANRAPNEPWVRPFVENVLGVYEDRIEDRPYLKDFLSTDIPATVIVASEPLMPEREVTHLPTLVDEPEREAIARRPNTTLIVAQGDHSIDLNIVLALLKRCLGELR